MRFPAIEFRQHGKKLYVITVTARDLLDQNRFKVDEWSPDNPAGYQRHLSKGRAKVFADFLQNPKNVSPTSILLAIREEPKFTPLSTKDSNMGLLEVPDSVTFYIVDGQHRVAGIRELHARGGGIDFSIPAVVMYYRFLEENDPAYCEAKQFVIINKTQKRVRADLHDRFVARLTPEQRKELQEVIPSEEAELTARAVAIADELNQIPGSPWQGAIKPPEVPKAPGVISQRTVTQSIITSFLEDKIIQASLDDKQLTEVIDNWWRAWREIIPDAFCEETRDDYVLQTTHVGVRVINELLRTVLCWLIPRGEALTVEKFCRIIEDMDEGNSPEFWKVGGRASVYRGEGGVRDLLDLLDPVILRALKRGTA